MTRSVRADVHEVTEEQNYHGVVLPSISRIMRVFTEKIYTFLDDRCVDLELDRSMRRNYVAV